MMPLMDGVGLAHLLRADPATRELIVILMSAARPPDLQAVRVEAFLTKPFDLDAVSRLLARSPDNCTRVRTLTLYDAGTWTASLLGE